MRIEEQCNYKEAYFTLLAEDKTHYSPAGDLTKYIDKMAMIGRKYRHLEASIHTSVQSNDAELSLGSLKVIYITEFEALTHMAETIINRFKNNKRIKAAVENEDTDIEFLVEDFNMVRLAVKARAMGARGEMQSLMTRMDRQSCSLLIK